MTHFSHKLLLFFLLSWLARLCAVENSSNFSGQSGSVSLFQVGVVLDWDSLVGRMGLISLSMAHSDFYSLHPNYSTRLVLHVKDSKGNTFDAASAALDLLKGDVEVDAIIGPQTSAQANFIVDIGDRAHVPIISFSATSPSLLSRTRYFVQTSQNDETQVGAIAAIVKAFRWKEIVLVYEDTAYGNDLVSYLSNAFQDIDARIPYRCIFPLSASDDKFMTNELDKLMGMQTRVFVVHMSSSLASRFFLKAKELGMMSEGYVWIITDQLTDLLYNLDSQVIEAMQGVLGVKPRIPESKELDSFTLRWKRKFLQDNPSIKHAKMSMFTLWAYDTLWALATAAEKVRYREPINKEKTTNSTTSRFDFGTSQTGPKLLKAISETRFKGLVGDFRLDNGQLRPSAFQIMNVVGKGEREVGVWTQSLGISRDFNSNISHSMSESKESFRKIIWPGESTNIPKGWEVPVSRKKMKIGVPIKKWFSEFVHLETDPLTNASQVKGFCIDMFDSVIKALPYAVPYEYVPYNISNATNVGTYNDLVQEVYLQKFDAAVGDITITANRSSYVDFTLPFSDGGVNMIVPVTYKDQGNAWTFFKPLTTQLWLTSIAFFVITGFVIWVLEHRVNAEFRGPPSQHVAMILWFSFSTLVFAHREKIVSNLAKLVVVVWLFVVLILSSSYTASLSSILTVQKLQPSVTDLEQLIKDGSCVGYPVGSFMHNTLKGMGFQERNLRYYDSPEKLDEDLSKGGENGGISAFFDMVANCRIFTSKYCGKYTEIGPVHRTDGFGFVFPKGSPLVADISRQLVAILEYDKIPGLERVENSTCAGSDNNVTSNSLSLGSFVGLFSITGCVTGLCLVIYLVNYMYENRGFLTSSNTTSAWSKFCQLCKHFDRRDLSSYPCSGRKAHLDKVSDDEDVVGGSSQIHFPTNSHSIAAAPTEHPNSAEEGMVVIMVQNAQNPSNLEGVELQVKLPHVDRSIII